MNSGAAEGAAVLPPKPRKDAVDIPVEPVTAPRAQSSDKPRETTAKRENGSQPLSPAPVRPPDDPGVEKTDKTAVGATPRTQPRVAAES